MPEFSLHAAYRTPSGRKGERNVLRQAETDSAAMARLRDELARQGHTKIDIRAWRINEWKDAANG